MTPQQMVWAREQVIFALNPPDKRQKGQLEAFGDFARSDTRRYGRQRKRTLNIDGRWYCRDCDPVFAAATSRYAKQPDMITPEAFGTVWMRRKIYSLEDYQRAWVLLSYREKKTRVHHLLVSEYIWMRMHERLRGKRITDRMTGNLIGLAWVAARNAAIMVGMPEDGDMIIAPTAVAQMIDISAGAWCRNYKAHWNFMHEACYELDHKSLESILE